MYSRTAIFVACCLFCFPVLAQSAPQLKPLEDVNAEVSLAVRVNDDGGIEGTMTNRTPRKIGDVEILVEYAWIWAHDGKHADDGPGWSMTYTLPVELAPGSSVPVNIAPARALPERNDGQFLISVKVVGYTRYRWVTPADQQP